MTYHDLTARIARVKAHLASRRGKRDVRAMFHLARLHEVLHGVQSIDLPGFDAVLKQYYTEDKLKELSMRASPAFALVKRKGYGE
jgi:hypothetical protein